jgi:hypothetical protein
MIGLMKQNKMRKILFILLTFVFVSCSLSEYKISKLGQKQLNFEELPYEIQKDLSERPKCDESDMLLFVDLADSTNYSLETVGTLIGPWVDYEKLIDKKNGFSYRIDQGVPSPYIIFRNKLYIPDRFNLLCGESVYDAKYTEYQLK